MTEYEATIEIESKDEAHSVRLLTEQLHNTLREEFRAPSSAEGSRKDVLEQFEQIRDATRDASPGTFRVVYEPEDGFDE